jgi:uncharacterized protein (TIGR03083 family)
MIETGINGTRAVFGETIIDFGGPLKEWTPMLVERFERPSALRQFSVRGLAGHLLRAMTSVETYLDRPPPAAGEGSAPISAAAYYAQVLGAETDIDSALHRSVRQRGLEAAPERPEDFVSEWSSVATRLVGRLEAEPPDRLMSVLGDLVLTLDEYLVTRLVEFVVHTDDLATSLGVPPPDLNRAATGLVVGTLVEVARIRHGDAAVVRSLARRERDTVNALRVL